MLENPKYITIEINKEKELISFTTFLKVDKHFLSLKTTRYLGYYEGSKNLAHPTFEACFYWSEKFYTNEEESNHHMYCRLTNTNYNYIAERNYEIQWKELHIKRDPTNKWTLIISDGERFHSIAIPPLESGERLDVITPDWHYLYGTEKVEKGIYIKVKDGSWEVE